MKEQLSKAAGFIARPVAILALLIGVGAIGAAVALAIDGGSGEDATRFQQLAERSGEDGDGKDHENGDSDGAGGEKGDSDGFGHGFDKNFKGFPEGFEGLPEGFGNFGEALEGFGTCLEEEGVEPPRGFGFGPGHRGEFGPGSERGDERGSGPEGFFFEESGSTGASFEPVHFRGGGGPGFFGGGGEADFDALLEGFEACADQLPEELQEPFGDRQQRFEERRENRGAFEDCLEEQGVGPEDEPAPGERPDEADLDRLRGAFEQCSDELGGPFGGPDARSGDQPQEG